MTTSSDYRSPSSQPPRGDHWKELSESIAVAAPTLIAELDHWFDEKLAELELSQESFVTNQSLRKNLRG